MLWGWDVKMHLQDRKAVGFELAQSQYHTSVEFFSYLLLLSCQAMHVISSWTHTPGFVLVGYFS